MAYTRTEKPILNGDIYCAPWCGCKCKKVDYDHCVKAADELAAKMGKGWEPDVWENMGWHYAIKAKHAQIHVNENFKDGARTVRSYWADIRAGGKQFCATAETPDAALGIVVQEARTFLSQATADLNELATMGD